MPGEELTTSAVLPEREPSKPTDETSWDSAADRDVEQQHTQDPVRLTAFCVLCCVLAGMGGMLHGYFNASPAGIESFPPFLAKFYPEVLLQPSPSTVFCAISSPRLQFFTGSHFLAAVALEGSGIPAALSRRAGRKALLACAALLFAIGSVLQTASVNVAMLVLGRVVAGFGLSCATVAGLLFITEVAPANHRGFLLNTFQVNLATGIMLAALTNIGLCYIDALAVARVALGLPFVISVGLLAVAVWLPDSPRSLLERGHIKTARLTLHRLRFPYCSASEFKRLEAEATLARRCLRPWHRLSTRAYRGQLLLSAASTLAQQLTGINLVVFYGAQLFINLGFSRAFSLIVQLILNAVLLLGSLVTVAVVDRVGRRTLLLVGSAWTGLCMVVLGVLLAVGSEGPPWLPWAVFPAACMFVLGYSFSWGPLGWTYPAEIHDLSTISAGMSTTTFCNVALSAVAAESALQIVCTLRSGLFFAFAGFCFAAGALVYWLFPETKGVPPGGSHTIFNELAAWRYFNTI